MTVASFTFTPGMVYNWADLTHPLSFRIAFRNFEGFPFSRARREL
jgi:hypothetical protein